MALNVDKELVMRSRTLRTSLIEGFSFGKCDSHRVRLVTKAGELCSIEVEETRKLR